MTRLVSIFKFLLILYALSGCGEAFRAQNMQPSNSETMLSPRAGRQMALPNSSNEAHPDQRIFNDYSEQMIGDEDNIRVLERGIEAMDLSLDTRTQGRLRISARLVRDCDQALSFAVEVDRDILPLTSLGAPLSLGSIQDHQLELRCNSSTCEQMVVAVRRDHQHGQTVLLVPMVVAGSAEGAVLYELREVQLQPYFASFRYDGVNDFSDETGCRPTFSHAGVEQQDPDEGNTDFLGLIEDLVDPDQFLQESLEELENLLRL